MFPTRDEFQEAEEEGVVAGFDPPSDFGAEAAAGFADSPFDSDDFAAPSDDAEPARESVR